jgi:hypothetical protein
MRLGRFPTSPELQTILVSRKLWAVIWYGVIWFMLGSAREHE